MRAGEMDCSRISRLCRCPGHALEAASEHLQGSCFASQRRMYHRSGSAERRHTTRAVHGCLLYADLPIAFGVWHP
jgi:hypothetical protein